MFVPDVPLKLIDFLKIKQIPLILYAHKEAIIICTQQVIESHWTFSYN